MSHVPTTSNRRGSSPVELTWGFIVFCSSWLVGICSNYPVWSHWLIDNQLVVMRLCWWQLGCKRKGWWIGAYASKASWSYLISREGISWGSETCKWRSLDEHKSRIFGNCITATSKLTWYISTLLYWEGSFSCLHFNRSHIWVILSQMLAAVCLRVFLAKWWEYEILFALTCCKIAILVLNGLQITMSSWKTSMDGEW